MYYAQDLQAYAVTLEQVMRTKDARDLSRGNTRDCLGDE